MTLVRVSPEKDWRKRDMIKLLTGESRKGVVQLPVEQTRITGHHVSVNLAANVRAQDEGTIRKPPLIADCAGNFGFRVISRPSPEDAKGPARAGASIRPNFSFGSRLCENSRNSGLFSKSIKSEEFQSR
jgi:hypothetical protein